MILVPENWSKRPAFMDSRFRVEVLDKTGNPQGVVYAAMHQDQCFLPLVNSNKIHALVDPEYHDQLLGKRWLLLRVGYCGYYDRSPDGSRCTIYLHRYVFSLSNPSCDSRIIDHINGNPLDNRLSNLRAASQSQNMCNRPAPKSNKSGYKGVSFHKQSGKWRATIKQNCRQFSLGLYDRKEDAANAYNQAAKIIHGDFAFLNRIQ